MTGPSSDGADLGVVLAHLREGVQVIGPDWRYLFVNAAAAAHGHSTPAALLGRTMTECYPGIDRTEMFARLVSVMDGGAPTELVNEFTSPDGLHGWFELRVQRVPMGIVVLSIDVTERQALERNLRAANRMEALGRLAGGIAHDFNNLLTVIVGYAAFVAQAAPSSAIAADARQIAGAAERAAKLTGQLLAFSRRKPVLPVLVDPWKLASDVVDLSSRVLGEQVEIAQAANVQVSPVLVDPGALEQVVLNLLLNARDAMDGAGRITIEGREVVLESDQEWSRGEPVPPGRYVVLSVTDTGAGMSRAVMDRLFDPFFSTKGERGTGLGLASSYGMVRQAGGYISVYSEVGKGTTFRVYLPAIEGRSVSDARPAAPPALAGSELVLVVDDEEPLLEVTLRALRRYGYEAQGATSAADAIARLREGMQPQLLVTDVGLPGMQGTELAAQARAEFPELRVLLMSGFASSAVPVDSTHELIEKPFTPAQLAERVRATLDRTHG